MTTSTVDLDAWFYDGDGAGNYGNGMGTIMAVGAKDGAIGSLGGVHRFAIRIPRGTLFDGITDVGQIEAFAVKLHVNDTCVGVGSGVRFFLERATEAIAETSYSTTCGLSTTGSGAGRWDGPARTATDRAGYSGAPSGWISVSALALAQWWYANPSVTALTLVAIGANAGLTDYDEANQSRRCTFHTRHSAYAPYAEITVNLNLKPNAPIDLSPADGATIASTNGTQAAVQFRHTDPEGNAATQYEVRWYPASATDAVPGTPTAGGVFSATTAHNALRSYTFTGLPARTAGRWRARFYDGQWGDWSLMQDATTAYQPGTPSGVSVEAGTQTPEIGANLVSSDGSDFVTAMEANVYQDLGGGSTITKWASGKQTIGGSPSRGTLDYAGDTLDYEQAYRLQVRLWNRDDVASAFTADVPFTQHAPIGPAIAVGGIPADTSVKQDTKTPTFTFTRQGGGNFDQLRVQYMNEAEEVLYDTGITSFAAVASKTNAPPAGTWDWSTQPKLRAAIRNSGESSMGPFSPVAQVRINYTPGAPQGLTITHATDQVVLRDDGVYVADTATPTLNLPFIDADKIAGYAETPEWQQVEVRKASDDSHFASSPYTDTTDPAETFVLPTLTAEDTYKVRGKYRDTAAVESAFSDYLFVKRSAKPTLSSVTPANAATVTDPTPAFAWTYASTGGKAQAAYSLVVVADGDEVYNSGLVAGDDAAVALPPDLLDTGQSVAWTLKVYDTDGLYATIERTFTTSFSQPAALTGLTLTHDEATQALVVAWDATALSADEFVAYQVYAKPEGAQFSLVATITDPTTTALLYRAAPHNRGVLIRVTQTNGWAESEPAEESAVLEVTGYWLKNAVGAWRLPDAHSAPRGMTHHGPGDTDTRLETFAPLGRDEEVILNWGSSGYKGGLALSTTDRTFIRQLRAWKDGSAVLILATPYGSVRYVRLTATPDDDRPAGWIDGRIEYQQVLASSADF